MSVASYSLALDVGTSFVEVALIDDLARTVLATARVLNKQVFFGTNVLARLGAVQEGHILDLQEAVQESVLDALAAIATSLQTNVGAVPENSSANPELLHTVSGILSACQRVVVAANSVMAPLFCGVTPDGLTRPPFTPVHTSQCQTGQLIELWRETRDDASLAAQMLPPLAAFVGADAYAVLIATGLSEVSSETKLVVDLGTNAEILLRKGDDLFVTSVPAGPAFEGVLGSGATGLRGSDVIRLVAQGVSAGHIDADGLVTDASALSPLTQHDVRDFQLAKAAVQVGIQMLLESAAIDAQSIDSFVLTGAFGSQLDSTSAQVIGLYPADLPLPRTLSQSSGALLGAIAVALGAHPDIAGQIHYVDLVGHPLFSERLLQALALR